MLLVERHAAAAIAKSIGLGVIGMADALERAARRTRGAARRPLRDPRGGAGGAACHSIPIAHIAGGDTTEGAFDEAIRHAITKMAHLHFVDQPRRCARACASWARTRRDPRRRQPRASITCGARRCSTARALERDARLAPRPAQPAGHLPSASRSTRDAPRRSSTSCSRRSTRSAQTCALCSPARTPTPAGAAHRPRIDDWAAGRADARASSPRSGSSAISALHGAGGRGGRQFLERALRGAVACSMPDRQYRRPPAGTAARAARCIDCAGASATPSRAAIARALALRLQRRRQSLRRRPRARAHRRGAARACRSAGRLLQEAFVDLRSGA